MYSEITEKLPEIGPVIDKNDELVVEKSINNQGVMIEGKDKRKRFELVAYESIKENTLSSQCFDCEIVKRLDPKSIEKAATIITEAFMDYPLPGQFIIDIDRRKKALKEMFKVELRKALKKGSVYTLGGDFQEVAIWKHEVVPESDFAYIKYVRLDTLKLLFNVRFKEFIRLYRALRNILAAKFKLNLPGNTVELYVVGVNPTNQGQGRLSRLLKPILKEKQGQGSPVLVMTNTDSNRKIYEHIGFKLIDVFDDKNHGCLAYFLVK